VIIFGGGGSPEANQASIEAHVISLKTALASRQPEVLFAAGTSPARTVQIRSTTYDSAGDVLALIFDQHVGVGVEYRAPKLQSKEAASRELLIAAIDRVKDRKSGTIVFGAGHGNPATNNAPAELSLWGVRGGLSVEDLGRQLDQQQRSGPIAFVLGQCHSGAFVDLMYAGSDKKRLVAPTRCVLAAVPADRQASGCTADVHDPAARAYLALIAESLTDRARSDLDKDGRVSLAEAHSYARVKDATVDVPISTSEAWLRAAFGEDKPDLSRSSVDALTAAARPEERAVLVALRPSVEPLTIGAVERALDEVDDKIEALERELDDLDEEYDLQIRRAKALVLERWPELANPYHSASRKILFEKADEIAHLVRNAPFAKRLFSAEEAVRKKSDEIDGLELKATKLERWLRAAENVAYETKLRATKEEEKIAALDALLTCERMVP
jgi:hypothetical protein